jgi:hypothetical protein
MANKIQVVLIDDIDGSEATETVTFGIDGKRYEIDLNAANSGDLRTIFGRFIEYARKVSTTPARRTATVTGGNTRDETTKIRQWAKAQGYDVKDVGLIPRRIRAEYHAT